MIMFPCFFLCACNFDVAVVDLVEKIVGINDNKVRDRLNRAVSLLLVPGAVCRCINN